MGEIRGLVYEAHKTAVEHGWWDEKRSVPECLCLMHSELSEALESYRNKEPVSFTKDGKPEGIASELADCVIRIFDFCGEHDIDLEDVIVKKMAYNKTRPYRHGGKAA